MDYRPLPEDRYEQFQDYLQYAFRPESGPQDEHDWDIEQRPGVERALFEDDEMLCVCRHYWFDTRVRGHWTEMPGLSAVASPPEHRRRGHVTALLAESLAEYRDRGDFLTALWAFEHPFYERQGWGLATKWVEYECPPDALAFARDHAAGEFRRVTADDFADLDPVLAADGEKYELSIDRSETFWRKRVFESWQTDPYGYAWDVDGETRGYVVFHVEDEDDGKRLVARELTAVDDHARLNLLRLLANHDSQVETVSIYGPDDTALLDRVADPADVECEVKAGPMVRLVDVPRAFEALDYSGVGGSFTLAVADPLADWNDRAFRVEVVDGRATCEPIENATLEPDVRAGAATLSQVYVGYHAVEDAELLGDLEIENSAARETLAAMFPSRDVFLREGF